MGDVDWGQGLQGAMGGAETGSFAGPWGALGGGVLGGLMGLFGGDPKKQYQDQLNQLAAKWGNRAAPQMGPAAQAGYSGFRSNQAGLISQLENMARGNGPSAAAIQMREAMDRAAAAQASGAAGAGGRGVNQGAASLNAANNTAAIQMQGARDTATMRAQEQMNAIGQLGNVISQGRNADEGINTFNAGSQNAQMGANLQASMQTMGLNQSGQMQALMAALGMQQPGLGTQIMAGGATAFPTALQFLMRKQGAPGGQQANSGDIGGMGGQIARGVAGDQGNPGGNPDWSQFMTGFGM